MTFRPTALERAFELAQSGDHTGMGGIREALRAEGYSVQQLTGGALSRQLRALCAAAQPAPEPSVD